MYKQLYIPFIHARPERNETNCCETRGIQITVGEGSERANENHFEICYNPPFWALSSI
jgi:hypothetical protein